MNIRQIKACSLFSFRSKLSTATALVYVVQYVSKTTIRLCLPVSVECFVEDQTFSLSYYLAPPPAPPTHHTLPLASSLSFSVFCVVAGRGAKSYDGDKAWSSINHSILSDDGVYSVFSGVAPQVS